MNYIDLIKNFWDLNLQYSFSGNETKLYFYLIETANRLRWEETFWHTDTQIIGNTGIGKSTFNHSRNKLKQAGLIDFVSGGQGHGVKSRYQILIPKSIPNSLPKSIPNSLPKSIPLKKTKTKTKTVDTKVSIPPTLSDVMSYFILEKNLSELDARYRSERFVNFYESKNWMVGKNKMSNWKSAATGSLEWEDKRNTTSQNGTIKKHTSPSSEQLMQSIAEGLSRARTPQEWE